jgi:uncharacterized protein YjbI with pentapeptide repeats
VANEEHVKWLNMGVAKWNAWRRVYMTIRPDLSRTSLSGHDLKGADLSYANLSGTSLYDAHLENANLYDANLSLAILGGDANLSGADLSYANLSDANLSDATLRGVSLRGANLTEASFGETIFAGVDLTSVIGLDTCAHEGPSFIDHRTLQNSEPLPLNFLRGVGLPDNLIEYLPSLLNQAIRHYSCFISYSAKDDEFAHRIHADLQNKGVRC